MSRWQLRLIFAILSACAFTDCASLVVPRPSFLEVAGRAPAGLSAADAEVCQNDEKHEELLLCNPLPELGAGCCPAPHLKQILTQVRRDGWHGDVAAVIRQAAPEGWLPLPGSGSTSEAIHGPAASSPWRRLHDRGVWVLDDFLSASEADIVARDVRSLEPIDSEVDSPALPTCGFRRSTTWVFFDRDRESKPMPSNLLSRIEAVTGVPKANFEPSQVVEYLPGDFFSDHYDTSACDHLGSHKLASMSNVTLLKSLACDAPFRRMGTFIVYLTDESAAEGGATFFPKLNVRVPPKRGRALFFHPTLADGSNDPWMLHSAETVLSGRKVLLQQWMTHSS